MKKLCELLFLMIFAAAFADASPKFYQDDPLMTDADNISIQQPTERPLSKTIDLLQKTFTKPVSGNTHAVNSSTLEEVPDSSWFVNRMSRRILSVEELVRGPNQSEGPDLSTPVKIIDAKTEGATPGLLVEDAKGDRYFFKFDPLFNEQMATSTEVVGTKFYHAFGYNVPENYLVYWNPKDYVIGSKAKVLWDSGKEEPISKGYVEDMMEIIPHRADGTIQVLASKFLPGKPLGPFDYQGVRKDDPNDIYPHEDRRELRALYVFDAWMNHNDSDSVNTLDMFFTDEQGRNYVKHNLIDFGTVFGSGATHPHNRRVGYEYYIEFTPIFKALGTLGLWERKWHSIPYPDYESLGRFESKHFVPQSWKADYPNPAFDKMDMEDAFWATRIVMRFTDEMIRAIVHEGKWEEPGAEDYLASNLIERRDKIVRYYLSMVNPLDDFQISSDHLKFTNLGMKAGLASECSYEYEWMNFNNETQAVESSRQKGWSNESEVHIPAELPEYSVAKISSSCNGQPEWKHPVSVYLRNGAIVGIERH